jgi:hypothetical protein
VKVVPEPAAALSVTVEFVVTSALQTLAPVPHVIPLPDTVPAPLTATLSLKVVERKFADTVLSVFIVIVQLVERPLHAPSQPRNVEPKDADAVSVTVLSCCSSPLQVEPPFPQLIAPAPAPPLTFPLPVTLTESRFVTAKVAVTLRAADMSTVHVSCVPEQSVPVAAPPVVPQPRNV